MSRNQSSDAKNGFWVIAPETRTIVSSLTQDNYTTLSRDFDFLFYKIFIIKKLQISQNQEIVVYTFYKTTSF